MDAVPKLKPQVPYAREIEKKFTVTAVTYEEAKATILGVLDGTVVEEGLSTDEFWRGTNVDFVRFRNNTNELTVKVTDRGTVTNRIEENVIVKNRSTRDCKRLLTLLFGPRLMELTKKFTVFVVGPCIISLYEVGGDTEKRLFLEVEAKSEELMEEGVAAVTQLFTMTQETRSLFQIFQGCAQ